MGDDYFATPLGAGSAPPFAGVLGIRWPLTSLRGRSEA
jgi:hypothetical protein